MIKKSGLCNCSFLNMRISIHSKPLRNLLFRMQTKKILKQISNYYQSEISLLRLNIPRLQKSVIVIGQLWNFKLYYCAKNWLHSSTCLWKLKFRGFFQTQRIELEISYSRTIQRIKPDHTWTKHYCEYFTIFFRKLSTCFKHFSL